MSKWVKRFSSLLLVFVIIGSVPMARANTADVPAGYIGIYTTADFDNIRNDPAGKYILMNDINFSEVTNFTPISLFTGILDGNGLSIHNLTIDRRSVNSLNVGIFGGVKGGEIKNLKIIGANICADAGSDAYVGGITGVVDAKTAITNCQFEGSIACEWGQFGAASYVGGIVGYALDTVSITDCYNYGDITGSTPDSGGSTYVGGIAGRSNSPLVKCGNFGKINCDTTGGSVATRRLYAGGIVGYAAAAIFECENNGAVKTSFSSSVTAYSGGIAAYCAAGASFSDCMNAATVEAYTYTSYAGGIAAYSIDNNTSYLRCLNTGDVKAGTGKGYAGGICAFSSGGDFSLCWNTGSVDAASSTQSAYAGGITGYTAEAATADAIRCWNTGGITVVTNATSSSYSAYAGGISGYWLGNTVSQCWNAGSVNATSLDVTSSNFSDPYAGGMVAYANNSIFDCLNSGTVYGKYSGSSSRYGYTGGIVGYFASTSNGMMTHCYNSGTLTTETPTSERRGGLVGICTASITSINSSYFLDTTADVAVAYNAGTYTDVKALSDMEMQMISSYAGFDFSFVWGLPAFGYPYLRNNQEILKYIVSYHANGGFGTPGAQIKNHDTDLLLPSIAPTRTGYAFLGWAAIPTATSAEYQPGDVYNANSNATLYAVWTPSCNITYNANGGIGAPASQTKLWDVDLILSSTMPTRTGYNFLGWATNSGANTAQYQPGDNYSTNDNVTLYAIWVSVYPVTVSDGTGSGVYESGSIVTITANTAPNGLRFMRWEMNPSVSFWTGSATSTVASFIMPKQAVIVTAVYETQTYSIIYNANGGTGAPTSQTKVWEETLIMSSTVPTRSGYTFLGWTTSSTGLVKYQPGDNYTTNANATLYATWAANYYTIYFSANGGMGVPDAQYKYRGQTITLSSKVPTRTGYTFMGWTTATTALYQPGDSYSADENIYNNPVFFSAVWMYNYTITFDTNDGTPVAAITQASSTSVSKPADPSKTGCAFAGWYTDEALTVAVTWPYTMGAADVTFYAKWTGNQYTVSFESYDGSPVTAITQNYNTPAVKPTDPAKTGFIFAGWYSDAALTAAVTWPYTMGAADVTFYAKWTVNQYAVSFESYGGPPVTAITQNYNTPVAKPTDPTKTGYTFAGWYTDEALTAAVTWPYTMGATNVTFYAKWKVNQCTIKITRGGDDVGDKIETKLKWYQYYKNISLDLGFVDSGIYASVKWSTDNEKVFVEQNGHITNIKSYARSANITIEMLDAQGGVITSDTVKVIFYKYNWQLGKLRSQAIVSDNFAQRNLSPQELYAIETPETPVNTNNRTFEALLELFRNIISILDKLSVLQ